MKKFTEYETLSSYYKNHNFKIDEFGILYEISFLLVSEISKNIKDK